MNEKMREMVGKGELSEAAYKKLVEELGRKKEQASAPLFEVTYTENVIFAQSHMDDDSDLNTCLVHFKTDYNRDATKTKIVRGVNKNPAAYRGREILFHKYHEVDLEDDGDKLIKLTKLSRLLKKFTPSPYHTSESIRKALISGSISGSR